VTITLLPAGMLAPDGRCKTLDLAADGYVRAETCAILLLAILSDDMAAHAIIHGSSVRQV
jgi:acyl transferase domain-containing protein